MERRGRRSSTLNPDAAGEMRKEYRRGRRSQNLNPEAVAEPGKEESRTLHVLSSLLKLFPFKNKSRKS